MYSLKPLFILSLFILGTSLSAQVVQVNGNTLEIGTLLLEDVNKKLDENIEGSPYINKEYIPAKINEIKKTHFVRLNAIDHTLEVKVATNKKVILTTKNEFNIQILDGSRRRYTTVSCPNKNGQRINAILEIISENDMYSLYKKERKKFVKAQKGSAYTGKKPAQYVLLSPIYYVTSITKKSTKVIEIPSKKKNFFALFEGYSKKVNQFTKQEKLSFTENEDLIRILNFYFEVKI